MANENLRERIGVACLIFLLGVVIGWALSEGNCTNQAEHPPPTTRTTSHPDSALIPISITSAPVKIHAKSNAHHRATSLSATSVVDSSLLDRTIHQVACIDTLLLAPGARSADTLHVCYDPPTDSFAIDLRFAPRDTNIEVRYVTHDSIIEHTQLIQSEKKVWYVEPVEILGSIVFGFLLGNLKK